MCHRIEESNRFFRHLSNKQPVHQYDEFDLICAAYLRDSKGVIEGELNLHLGRSERGTGPAEGEVGKGRRRTRYNC